MKISDLFSPSAGLRDWRRGRFHVMEVPAPGQSEVITHPRFADVSGQRLPDHVTLTASNQPDGVFFVTRCTGCGARIEDSPFAATRLGRLKAEPFNVWLSKHAACDTDPLVNEMPNSLVALAQRVSQVAEQAVSLGEMVPPHLYLVSENGRVWAVPYRREGAYGSELDHDVDLETAWLHIWLRRWQRERGVRLEAALTIAEAWATFTEAEDGSAPPSPREIVFGAAVTNDAGFYASSDLIRTGSTPGVGAGSFQGLDWTPLVDEAPIVDLLLAA